MTTTSQPANLIAVFEYRCRRCGAINTGGVTGSENAVRFLANIEVGETPPGLPLRMVGLHRCEDGGWGVTDLIGAAIRKS